MSPLSSLMRIPIHALEPFNSHVNATPCRATVGAPSPRPNDFNPFGPPVIPMKGEVRRHHFAHKGGGSCADGWSRSYDDSEWHHLWQERFPRENQEITLTLGEVRHRADVLTETTVVEFQRSALTPEQFNERNTFYQDLGYKVVWLYDLRDAFREGALREEPHKDAGLRFSWGNPRKAFRAYDLERGDVDLFLQLRDEGDGPCIVRPEDVSPNGFETCPSYIKWCHLIYEGQGRLPFGAGR